MPACETEQQAAGAEAYRSARAHSTKPLQCAFCQAELGDSREVTSTGSFCSTRCRDSVLALAALHPSLLASYDFVTRRELLTDQLLHLWRRGRGPDPGLVLEAARRAGRGLPSDYFGPKAGKGSLHRKDQQAAASGERLSSDPSRRENPPRLALHVGSALSAKPPDARRP